MPLQFPGRVLAAMTVPAVGAAYSASTGAHGAAVSLTLPGGDYFMTQDGGLSGLLATWQQQLNDNVQGYPQTAAAMRAAVGYGTWSAGYLCNETSGNLAPAFGAPALAPISTPTYADPGPRGGIDLAVGLDSAGDGFTGGNVHDAGTGDLCLAWVGYFTGTPGSFTALIGKGSGADGWIIYVNSGFLVFGSHTATAHGVPLPVGWYAGMACIDRGAGAHRLAVMPLGGGPPSISSGVPDATYASSSSFIFGGGGTWLASAAAPCLLSALYVGTGAGAASGLSANLSTALTNFANAINAEWSVGMSEGDGRITVANSFWPASVQFTDTTLRDVAGFEYDFDYPKTPAQLAAAVGGGVYAAGAGWLCDEAAGSLAPIYGTGTLAPSSSPTYSNLGPRGGADKAVGFDSGGDIFTTIAAHNADATSDLIIAMVAKVTNPGAAGQVRLVLKASSLSPVFGYYLHTHTDGSMRAQIGDGVNAVTVSAATIPSDTWCVVLMVLERATNSLRVGYCPLFGGAAPTVSSIGNAGAVGTLTTAAGLEVGGGLGAGQQWQCAAWYLATGVGAATGLSANLPAALASFAASMKSQTGTKQCRGLWFPRTPIFVAESDPRLAPVGSDARTSVSGSGDRITHVGVYHRIHRSIRWSHVPISQIREQSAEYANGSFRTFWDDTQLAKGPIPWFHPGSSLCIVDHNGNVLGQDMQDGGPTEGWGVTDPRAVEPKRVDPRGYTGHWLVEIPELIAKDE
jgi:hypothetical protein